MPVLQIWQEPFQAMRVGGRDDARLTQMPFALTWLMRELMAHEGSFKLKFPCRCLTEALGSSPFGLELWHDLLAENEDSLAPFASRERSPGMTG